MPERPECSDKFLRIFSLASHMPIVIITSSFTSIAINTTREGEMPTLIRDPRITNETKTWRNRDTKQLKCICTSLGIHWLHTIVYRKVPFFLFEIQQIQKSFTLSTRGPFTSVYIRLCPFTSEAGKYHE